MDRLRKGNFEKIFINKFIRRSTFDILWLYFLDVKLRSRLLFWFFCYVAYIIRLFFLNFISVKYKILWYLICYKMVLCIQSIKCSEFANNMFQNLHYCIPDHFRPLSTLMWSKNTFTRPWISLPSFLSTLYWDKTLWTGRSRLWTVVSCQVLCHGLWTRQTDDRKLIWGNLFIILYQIYPILWGHRLSENVEFAYTTCL